MDHVFQPDQRRWISPLTNLGKSIEDLKRLVQFRKEDLLVIDPTAASTMRDNFESGTAAPGGIKKDAPSQFLAVDYPVQAYDVMVHANSLHQEIEKAKQHKWSNSDAACEAAVAAIGGPDFFKMSKSNNTVMGAPTVTPKEEEPQPEPEKDAVTDFKQFSEWAFNQAKKRDEIYKKNIRPDLMVATNLSENEIANLQKFTSANLASVKGEVFQDEALMKSSSMPLLAPPIERSVTLQSLAIFITHGEEPSRFPWKSVNVQQQMNDDFAHDMFVKRMERQKIDMELGNLFEDLVDKEDDFLVQILIYQPTDPDEVLPDEVKMGQNPDDAGSVIVAKGQTFVPERYVQGRDYSRPGSGRSNRFVEPKLAYELHMLGSQTVGDLMKAIQCENDYIYLQEVEHPDNHVEDPNQFAKRKFESTMIMIHDTIYHNKAMPNQDYIKIINEWAKKAPKKLIEEFKEGDPKTQLRDLNLRFGYPYIYIHLGGCEHLIVFTKARLLHWEDDHRVRCYPKINGMTRFRNVNCRVDNEYLARWAVLDCKEFPENPMLLCSECVKMYCYDKNKKKRCHFRLLPFTQLANML